MSDEYYEVQMEIRWMRGAAVCTADIIQRVHAPNVETASSKATDCLREWFPGEIELSRAAKVEI